MTGAEVQEALGRLRRRCTGDQAEALAAAEGVGIENEHDLRLVLAALGYTPGSNAEAKVLDKDYDDFEAT